MARMRVELLDIMCGDTEDVSGGDEFYLAGAVSDGGTSVGVLTAPVSINNGQTKGFADGGGVVFDADVPDGRILKVALVAFDEDSGKDWAKRGEVVTKIGGAVAGGLAAIPNPYTLAAAAILPFAIQTVGGLMSLDQDDDLGQHAREFPVGALPNGTHLQTWSVRGGGGWWSSWRYTVRYQVTKG